MGVELQVASLLLGLGAAKQQRDAAELEARSYEEQAKMAEISSRQEEEERRTQLRKQLASLSSSMSAQGVALGTSASTSALKQNEIALANKDISSIKLMGMSNRRKYELSAAGSRAEKKAITLGAMGSAASGAYDIKTT